jgi:hypothetical protein
MSTEPANESRNEEARHQVDHHLQVKDGGIILFSKSSEAEGEEAGVSRQADEGGGNGWRAARMYDGSSVDAVG